LASVASSDEPTGVLKFSVVSEKSALGTNSVPSSGSIARLSPKIAPAATRVSGRWASDQRRMPW